MQYEPATVQWAGFKRQSFQGSFQKLEVDQRNLPAEPAWCQAGLIASIPTGVAVAALGRLHLTLFARVRTLATGYGRDTAQSRNHACRCD